MPPNRPDRRTGSSQSGSGRPTTQEIVAMYGASAILQRPQQPTSTQPTRTDRLAEHNTRLAQTSSSGTAPQRPFGPNLQRGPRALTHEEIRAYYERINSVTSRPLEEGVAVTEETSTVVLSRPETAPPYSSSANMGGAFHGNEDRGDVRSDISAFVNGYEPARPAGDDHRLLVEPELERPDTPMPPVAAGDWRTPDQVTESGRSDWARNSNPDLFERDQRRSEYQISPPETPPRRATRVAASSDQMRSGVPASTSTPTYRFISCCPDLPSLQMYVKPGMQDETNRREYEEWPVDDCAKYAFGKPHMPFVAVYRPSGGSPSISLPGSSARSSSATASPAEIVEESSSDADDARQSQADLAALRHDQQSNIMVYDPQYVSSLRNDIITHEPQSDPASQTGSVVHTYRIPEQDERMISSGSLCDLGKIIHGYLLAETHRMDDEQRDKLMGVVCETLSSGPWSAEQHRYFPRTDRNADAVPAADGNELAAPSSTVGNDRGIREIINDMLCELPRHMTLIDGTQVPIDSAPSVPGSGELGSGQEMTEGKASMTELRPTALLTDYLPDEFGVLIIGNRHSSKAADPMFFRRGAVMAATPTTSEALQVEEGEIGDSDSDVQMSDDIGAGSGGGQSERGASERRTAREVESGLKVEHDMSRFRNVEILQPRLPECPCKPYELM